MTQAPMRGPASAAWAQRAVPENVAAKAEALGWSVDLVERVLNAGMTMEDLERTLDGGCAPDAAEALIARLIGQTAAERTFAWMSVGTELGVRVRPGPEGLRLGDLNVGSYGAIPEEWPDRSMRPRGAAPVAGVPDMGYSIFRKADLWSENVAELYEDAIQAHRRWKPATTIPWETIQLLSREVEASMTQACTKLCEGDLLTMDVVGMWLPRMSYGFHEVKCYLSTLMFDAARHFEAFRKRALYTGRPPGVQAPGYFFHGVKEARTWPEVSLYLNVLHATFTRAILSFLREQAHNDAEAALFGDARDDVERQMSYGFGQVEYLLAHHPERTPEFHVYLDTAEKLWAVEWERDEPLREALIVIGAGDVERTAEGRERVARMLGNAVRDYTHRLRSVGVDRGERLNEALMAWGGAVPV